MHTNEKAAPAGTGTASRNNTHAHVSNHSPREQRPDALPLQTAGIPDDLKAAPRWVLWRHTWNGDKWAKKPLRARGGYPASSVKPTDWTDYATALAAYSEALTSFDGEPFDGLGFVLGDGYHGIDVDDCRAPDGSLSPLAVETLAEVPGYAEVSPSGQGLKIITRSNLDRSRTRHEIGLETYTAGRYFTITGHGINGHDRLPETPVDLSGFALKHFGATRSTTAGDSFSIPLPPLDVTPEQIRATLSACLRAGKLDSYSNWLEIGMALHHQFQGGDDGLGLWDEYSSQAAGYSGREALETRWRGFDAGQGDGVTFATVLKWAKDAMPKALPNTPFPFAHCRDLLTGPRAAPWLIRHWLEAGSLALIFGESTAGKTFVVLDWACCVATGTPWNNRPVRQGSVFYIAGEGRGGLGKRLAAWGQHHGLDMAGHPLFVSERGASLLDAIEAENIADAIRSLAAEHGEPALVVVDTLHRNLGQGDENSAEDVAAFLRNIDQSIRLPLGCAVLVVHHPGHGDKTRSRGSYAIKAALDAEFCLAINGDVRDLECTKQKDSEPPAPVHLASQVVRLPPPWEEDGEAMTSLVFTPTAPAPRAHKPPTGGKLTALKALRRLAAEAPEGRVALEAWRIEFHATHPADSSEAKKKAFQRATKDLLDAEQVTCRDDFCWEVPELLAF